MMKFFLNGLWMLAMSAVLQNPMPVSADEAHEIGFVEEFVLSRDRAKALETLIPGTDIYYFYQALQLQNAQDFGAVDRVLNTWRQRHGETRMYQEIRNRQMLLTYSEHPQQTLDFLIRELRPKLDHRREQLEAKPQLPSILEASVVDFERIKQQLLRDSKTLDGFFDSVLHRLTAQELSEEQRRELLSRLNRPTHPQLLDMVLADLNYQGSRGFGSLNVHNLLTLPQLEQLADRQPSLRNQTAFIHAYIRKLHPSPDVDWQNDPEAFEAYLQRLWRFVQDLSPAHNSLKALVLYHWLELGESQGRYDRDRFQKYLELPRPSFYVARAMMEAGNARRYAADLNLRLDECPLAPIQNDEPLVRRYLLEFFRQDDNYRSFAAFVQDDYLKAAFAESKITNGLGNPEDWYSLISPDQYQALKDRVDIDFAPTNPRIFRANDTVQLNLLIKHVDKLIVKVYEVNTQNFYRDQGREVNTDIQLDGLVPNQSFTYEYEETPFLRKKRSFDFPQLEQPGVYVIDFIGNGKSSRTVVRKGQLTYLAEVTPDGHAFRVLNDAREIAPNASIWMAGQHYEADDQGVIHVPFSTAPGRQPIVLQAGNLASLQFFEHQSESYKLTVAAHFDRESLLERREAVILLRPQLLLNGTPVAPALLENVSVTVTSTNLDGIQSTKQFEQVQLADAQDTPIDIAVPSRLASLRVDLRGTITDARSRPQTYEASHEVAVNQIDATDKIEDVHLTRIGDQFLLQLLGKNGESRPHRALNLSLQHEAFKEPQRVQLATNEKGFVHLGPLEDIVHISVDSPTIQAKSWPLPRDRRTDTRVLHALADQAIRVPHMLDAKNLAEQGVSLFELRGDSFARERTNEVQVQPNFVEIRKLPPGDYHLQIGQQTTHLKVTAGPVVAGYAAGDVRHLELRKLEPLQITSVTTQADQLEIKLANSSEYARVHVYATRFVPAFDPFDSFARMTEQGLQTIHAPSARSYYMAGRKLGDELKYVLDRAYARKYPGNMLDRPSLLLNSWPMNDTQTATKKAADGDDFDADVAAAAPSAAALAEQMRRQADKPADFANLDFLSQTTSLLANLTPDARGVIQIPVEKLGGHQHIHVIALDPLTTVYRSHTLETIDSVQRDLRLVNGLDANKHYTQQKVTSLLAKGETFQLEDISTSKFDTYDSLRRVYDLYSTVSSNATLQKFAFVVDWPTLSSEEKQAKYSEYACHELHYFLYKKDPDFFEQVVRPYLENKFHKTFLDAWLLQSDLTRYVEPWNFAQLNSVERVLLAERLPEEVATVRRLLADQLALVPVDFGREELFFESALGGRALDRSRYYMEAESLSLERKADAPARGAVRFSVTGKNVEMVEERLAELSDRVDFGLAKDAEGFAEKSKSLFGRRRSARGRSVLFEQLDTTKEWAETNYYQLPIAQHVANLIEPGEFWLDYANRDPQTPFFSIHWPAATRNFPEMLFALSVLDLPFEAAEHKTEFDELRMTLTASSPMVVFHQQVRETEASEEASPLLIKQNYFRADERYEMVKGQRRDKFVTDEFLTHVVYGCQIVLTNPTSSPRQVEILQQIPHRALATSGGQATKSSKLALKPYHTETLEYFFYFPEAGAFPHFPAHVTEVETLLGHANPAKLQVVETRSQIDEASWEYVSQFASDDAVITYLENHNLLEINLSKMAFRMSEPAFFQRAIELLEARHVYHHELWAYSLKHNDAHAIATYLLHSDNFLANCGQALSSDLVTIQPVERRTYQHLDYKPLVNARAHQLGDRRSILNNRFYDQYHRLLHVLKYHGELTNEDRATLTYYLLLQDRIEEAIAMFAQVDRSQLDAQLQYDYFAAYLDCFNEQPELARSLVTRHINHPVPKWQRAFASVKSQLDELEGDDVQVVDPQSQLQSQTLAASEQANFDFQLEGARIHLNSQHVDRVNVNYYLVDLELLFSRNPFVQNFDGQFAHIRPHESRVIELAANEENHTLELPEDLRNRNVLVEIEAAGMTRSRLYSSNSLTVQMSENYGQLKVVETKSGKRLPKTYVKVYAQNQSGEVTFYKDGYTDIRGRFDYASLSTNQLDQVQRFSILVLDEDRGGLVREARTPKR